MNPKVNIYQTKDELVIDFAKKLSSLVDETFLKNNIFNLMLSGGRTPVLLYKFLGGEYNNKIQWNKIHFFWGDERCVPSDYPDSNFGEASKVFFKKTNIPLSNIHPIVGESHPYLEADRYSTLMHKHFDVINNIPTFDLVLLGLGKDGHVASLFPDQLDIFHSNRLFEVTSHPDTGQQRITATGKLINNSNLIFFIVTGKNKAEMVRKILNKDNSENLPASLIAPELGEVIWFLDKEAAELL